MKQNYVASVSFGKDSLCMLLMLIEKEYPLDEVVFFDTGMEFQAVYNLRDKIIPLLQGKGIKYTEVKPEKSFEWNMFERPVTKKDGTKSKGYSWCGGRVRWMTSQKTVLLDKILGDSIQYIGIAYDEAKRVKDCPKRRYPLVEWKITEREALEYCRAKGYNWIEGDIDLYDVLDRVSCWCCTQKNLKELRNYYLHLPEYWEKLKDLQRRTDRPYKGSGRTVFDLEERFKRETRGLLKLKRREEN